MVKIVGRDEAQVLHTSCRSCAARLEYTRGEVQSYTSHDYGGGSDTCYYITCPSCGSSVTVRRT